MLIPRYQEVYGSLEVQTIMVILLNFMVIITVLNSNLNICCKISLQLKWSKKYILVAGTVDDQNPSFQINDTKFYVPVVI